jgi:hypothetical protein
MPRRLVLPLALAACLAAAPSAQSKPHKAAKPPKPPTEIRVHADVTFQLDYTTNWEAPRLWLYRDCFKTSWREGKGSEVLSLKSRKPQRLVFTIVGDYGSLSAPGREARTGALIKLGGRWTREYRWRAWTESGPCGGPAEENPPEQTDCGTRLPNWEVLFLWFGNLNPAVGGDQSIPNREQEDFDNCKVFYPRGSGRDGFFLRAQKLPISTVLRRRTFSVGDDQSWKDEPGSPGINTQSHRKWKATFKRVKVERIRAR